MLFFAFSNLSGPELPYSTFEKCLVCALWRPRSWGHRASK